MKYVYIVLEKYPHEGYSKPQGVFSSKQKAEEYVDNHRDVWTYYEIFKEQVL